MTGPDIDTLKAAASRDAAADLLAGMTVRDLRDYAQTHNIRLNSLVTRKADLIDRIVDLTAGVRITREAIRGDYR